MKKILAFVLALVMLLTLCACGGSGDAAPAAEEAATAEPTEVQQMWNGWYFGCVDYSDCTGDWEAFDGETFDATMYVELNKDGVGSFTIYDPFGVVVQNANNNLVVEAACHADTNYLYVDTGKAFGYDMNASDWMFVHNTDAPEKLNFGAVTTYGDGETIGADFQFRPWGDRWEDDDYKKFIPYFDSYIGALDSGLGNPFGETFNGFGIAGYDVPGNGVGASADEPAATTASEEPAAASTAAAGNLSEKLDVNGRGIVYVYYSPDFYYDDDYGKLKNDDTGVGILIDPMLGAKNMEELKASYETNNKDEDDYSLVETTINGYRALVLKYSDWLGATMRVDLDFGGEHDGYYGISFSVSGDALADCDTDAVWAIINSMELAK